MPSPHEGFGIRENSDGSFDVICLHCFATAGTTKNESELLAIEQAHQCDLLLRSRFAPSSKRPE